MSLCDSCTSKPICLVEGICRRGCIDSPDAGPYPPLQSLVGEHNSVGGKLTLITDIQRELHDEPCSDCKRDHINGEHVTVSVPALEPDSYRIVWEGCVDCWIRRGSLQFISPTSEPAPSAPEASNEKLLEAITKLTEKWEKEWGKSPSMEGAYASAVVRICAEELTALVNTYSRGEGADNH